MEPDELALAGRGLAGLSHDLKNVLAILAESAGLVEDLLAAGSSATGDARIPKALASVARQLDRAEGLVSHLNRFAHTFDDPGATLPVGQVVATAAFLVDRAARSRDVRIEVDLPPDVAATQTGPQPLRLVLFVAAMLERGLERCPPGSRLSVASSEGWLVLTGGDATAPWPPVPSGILVETGCRVRAPDPSRGALVGIRLP